MSPPMMATLIRSGVAGTCFEDIGGVHYWENWSRVREDGEDCFDNYCDFAISASHYTNIPDLRNYFFARAAAMLGEEAFLSKDNEFM